MFVHKVIVFVTADAAGRRRRRDDVVQKVGEVTILETGVTNL